jgi:hypothetical protein
MMKSPRRVGKSGTSIETPYLDFAGGRAHFVVMILKTSL